MKLIEAKKIEKTKVKRKRVNRWTIKTPKKEENIIKK
jgi:hypothetical protein